MNSEYSAGRMRVSDIRRPGEGRLSEREYTQRELTADVRRNGVQQPLAIEDFPVHGGPTTFNGLHRLDAAERAGVHDVPVVVRHRKGILPPMTEHRPSTEDEFNAAFDLEREGRWRGGKTAMGNPADYGIGHRPLRDGAPAHDLHEAYAEDIYTHPQYWGGTSRSHMEGLAQLRRVRGKPDAMVDVYRASHHSAPHELNHGDWVTLSKSYAAQHAYVESGSDDPDAQYQVHHARVPAKHVRDAGTDQYCEQGYWGPDMKCCGKTAARINTPPSGMDWEENLRFLRHRKRSEPLMHRGLAVELPPEVHNLVHDQFQDRDRQARAIAEHLRGRPLGMHWSAGEQTPRHFADWERKNNSPGSTKVILHAALPEVEHIETDPEKLNEGGVFRYGGPGGSEHEIPMKAGAPVRIKGVTWYGYGNRKRSGDLYDHVHTASLTPRDELPPDPGTKPIPEGHVRLWHYTPLENADSIREHGLLRNKARGDAGNGDLSEPSAGVWASTAPPKRILDDHSGHAAVVEYHAHPSEISGNAESPWQAMRKDRTWDDEKVQSWANSGGHHVIMRGDVPPSHILDVHEPWHGSARYMRDDKSGHSSYGWVRDEYAKGDSPELEPYVRGLDALEKGHRHEAATNWDEFHAKVPDEIHRGLYAPQSHGVFSMPMSDEDIAHGLIGAHQEEHFPYERDQRKLFGTHWTSDEGVARNFAQEHEREHHEDPQCSDHDEHSEATQVVFHAERPARHEIEHDPRRLGWQNVDDYDTHEKEVPIKHGAPVRIKGVSWLKHTGLGPMWHRHDLRKPVELRAEDRDSPDDPNQWNASLHHEAAAGKGLPYMPEPSDSQLEEHLYRRHGLDPELTPHAGGKHWHRWHASEHQHRTDQDHQHEHLTGAPLEESYSMAFQPEDETDTWGYSGGHSTPPGHQDIPQTSPLLTGDPNRHLSATGGSFQEDQELYEREFARAYGRPKTRQPRPVTWYHGTHQELKPGTMMTPQGATDRWEGKGVSKHDSVFITKSQEAAQHYADYKAHEFGGGPRVYEVHPHGEVKKDANETWLMRPGNRKIPAKAHRTDDPVEVLHEVPWDTSLEDSWTPGSRHMGAAGHLPNPHTGGSEWFHGTQAHKEDLSKGFADPVSMSTGLYQTPESENDDSGHWNSLLGTHFTADHVIADEFAKDEHSGSNNEGYGDDQDEHEGVVHAKLNIKNPKHYASEHDMDHEAYEHEHAAGNHPINHLSDYGPEGDEDADYERHEMWPHAMQIHHDYGKSEIPASTYGHYMSPFEKHPMRTAWLNTHPDKVDIAQRFKQRLQAQGHDGITYGNEYEKSRHGQAGNTSAIVFHPDQAEITEHHHVEEPCQHEPLSHLAAAWTPSQRIFGPTYGLDHRLFEGDYLRPEVRQVIMERVAGVLGPELAGLTRVYLAGSEASEWTGPDLEGNGDFDTLIGVQFDAARRQVPGLAALTDMEIADKLNHLLRAQYNEAHWHPAFLSEDDRWGKEWDLTGYVNVNGWDIRDLKPYAAYDITDDRWAVKPPHLPGNSSASFPAAVLAEARAVAAQVRAILKLPEPDRTREGISLWNKIHADRSAAFGPSGHGWDDPGNVIEKFLDQHPHHLLDKLRGLKFKTASGDRYVTCGQGHTHWGAHGAAGLLVRHKGEDGTHRYLLQKRGDDVDHGGTWSTPGGALHAGESPQEGALRESREELGELPGDLTHHHTVTDDHGGWAYHTVVMDSPHQFTPEGGGSTDHEHAGHGWFSPDEVKDLNLHPGFARTWDTVRQSRTDKTAASSVDIPLQYHSSPFPHGFPHDEYSHVGTRKAAEERVSRVSPVDYDLPADSPATLHTVRLRGRVYPHVLTDDQADDIHQSGHTDVLTDHGLPSGRGYHIFPYVNDGEDKGSTSYIAHKSAIHVLKTEQVSNPGWYKTAAAPAYNGPYYHGTAHRFKPGDLISPGGGKAHDVSSPDHVYLAASESVARTFGGLAAVRNKAKTYGIYQVEPTGPVEPDPDGMGHRSSHPLRVVRLHERGAAPGDPNPWWNQPGTDRGYPRPKTAALDVKDYDGTTGDRSHITRSERGMIPTSAVAGMRGVSGEVPGEHRNRQGQRWEDFKQDISSNGIRTPLFITVDHGEEPELSEGSHRRDAAVELGLPHVPAEIRYFGHAEQQGTVLDRAGRQASRHTAAGQLPPGYAMEVQQEEETHWGHPALHLNVSHEGKPVAGLGVFQRPDPETGSLVGHPNVWVHPGHQRKGLGTAMYAEVHRRWPGIPVKHSPHSSDDALALNQVLKERFGPDLHYGRKTAARAPGDPIFHGTRHEFRPGDLISPGHPSNWPGVSKDRKGTHTYATEDLDEATHFAEQARKPGAGHVYQVEPTGRLLRDRELDDTDLVKSYQSRHPLRVVTEVPREMLPKHYNLDPIPQHAWDSDDSLRGRYGDWKSHQAVIRPGSLPDLQQSAFDVEDMREHRRQMLDVAKNPDPGTRVWRGELRPQGEHPSEATSVGMHWSVNPDSIIGRADQHEHVKSMGLRPVVWQGVVENHKEQAFGRGHPMWYGRHESFGHEAEVRFKPGARVRLEGAYVHDPGGGGENNYLVPQIPERTSPNWKWHPLDHHVTIAHRPGNIGTSDYSDLGIPKEAAVRDKPDSEYGGLMVAIVPPAGIVEHLTQDGGEDPDDLHVTLLYIGKGDDLAPGQAARLPELVSQWAKTCSPMKARTSGAGTFVSDERQHVLWASVDIPGIERAHVSLVDFLRGHGIKINEDYGYTPHITLKYEKWHVRFLPKIQPMSWDVSEIWFCQGGHWESYPLGRVLAPA